MEGFAQTAKPLHQLVAQQSKKQLPKKSQFQWTPTCQTAFETIIRKLTSPPVLVYPDFSLPFTLHTDASGEGLGAALYQVQDGRTRVITYGSRTLNDAERKYSAYRREFLALKWAITEKFRPYLYGYKFHLVTDSNPLTYLVTSAKLSATDHRWLSGLASFDFTITYRAGKAHSDADGLSRVPYTLSLGAGTVPDEDYVKPFLDRLSPSEEALHVCPREAFQAICQYHQVLEPFNPDNIPLPVVEAISMSSQTVDHTLFGGSGSSLPLDWSSLQQKDPLIGRVLSILHLAQSLDQLRSDNPESVWMFRERSRLVLKDGDYCIDDVVWKTVRSFSWCYQIP